MMTDEKAQQIDELAADVVRAMELKSVQPSGGDAVAMEWDDLDDLAKNKVRVAIAGHLNLFEEQWMEAYRAEERQRKLAEPKVLGMQPL